MRSLDLIGAGDFPVRTAYMSGQVEDVELHRHANVELVLVCAGHALHDTGVGKYPIQRGDIFVIPVGMAHRYVAPLELHLWNIGYVPQRLDLPHARLARLPGYRVLVELEPRLRDRQGFAGHLRLTGAPLTWLLGAISELDDELRTRADGWQDVVTAQLQSILLRLARAYAAQDTPAARAGLRLAAVLAHIERHLADDLAIDRLAEVGYMSPSTLQRTFRTLVGTSVAQHIMARRLEAGARYLEAGAAVADAARRCGFADSAYFTRLFRRWRGETPTAFRSRMAVVGALER